ncbi:MAG: threonine-phosphate decarboxylase CobD [Pseudomonadota bacterium]
MSEVFHGGGLDAAIARYGGRPEEWLDLSTGINPNPYPVPEISPETWARLPDKHAEQALLGAARQYYRVPDGFEIVAAPGTQALIQLLPRLLKAKEIAVVSPTYGEHRHVWKLSGSNVTEIAEPDEIKAFTGAAVVVNPNNPDCRVHSVRSLVTFAGKLDFLVVDEAFCDTMPENSLVPTMPENAVVLKSFGKFFGLAGLRLGFAICKKEWAERFKSMMGPWAVSGQAIELGSTAFTDVQWIQNTRQSLLEKSRALATILQNAGLKIEGQNPLFVYARHDNAMQIHGDLAKRRILVRSFSERRDHLRFGLCKDHDEFSRLEAALKACVNA